MLRILIVDDDESIRQLLSHNLEQDLGVVTDEANSGNDAINLIGQGLRYCLIISDYNMPDGNGAVLQNYLVENKIESFFCFYTSESDVVVNENHQKFLGVITKPNIQKLFEKLVYEICERNLKKNGLALKASP